MSDAKTPGRLRGGLSRLRAFLRSRKALWVRLGWYVAESFIGFAIGVLLVTLWLRYR